jgi:hypothetical protein
VLILKLFECIPNYYSSAKIISITNDAVILHRVFSREGGEYGM